MIALGFFFEALLLATVLPVQELCVHLAIVLAVNNEHFIVCYLFESILSCSNLLLLFKVLVVLVDLFVQEAGVKPEFISIFSSLFADDAHPPQFGVSGLRLDSLLNASIDLVGPLGRGNAAYSSFVNHK